MYKVYPMKSLCFFSSKVEQAWVPWSFSAVTLESDIAIIQMDRPVNYSKTISPICYLVKSFERFPKTGSIGKVSQKKEKDFTLMV